MSSVPPEPIAAPVIEPGIEPAIAPVSAPVGPRLLRVVDAVTTPTHCPYCAFQCGMSVTTVTSADAPSPDRPDISVRPDPAFPVNRGQMCIKGFTSGDLLDHPGRLTAPMMRTTSGRLAPVSWEVALDFIAERLIRLREAHGPEALAAFGSGALTNEKAYLLGKFARVVLRTPNIDYNGRYCMSSAAARTGRSGSIAGCRSRSVTSRAPRRCSCGAPTPARRCRRSCSGFTSSAPAGS